MSTDRLHYLLDAYASKRYTDAEMDELNRLLQDDWARMELDQQVPHIDWDTIYREITASPVVKIDAPARKTIRIRNWWVAASILIIASVTVVRQLTYNKNSKQEVAKITGKEEVQKDKEEVQTDIAPGGDKAILFLANGQQIILDSAADGILTRQGNAKVIKLASGQITYLSEGEIPSEIMYNTLRTPRGGQYKLTLPDGTDVWLNTFSSISYPTAFGENERKVAITGEVYFEVAKDVKKPFLVKVNEVTVEVLGTQFNVNAYDDEPEMKLTLLEGSIKLAKGTAVKILKPGQQARVKSEVKVFNAVNLDAVMAWKNGLFTFDRADIQTVMRQIGRWYDVDIVYKGTPTTDVFGGDIQRNLPLSKVLDFLRESKVHFVIEGKKLTVMP